MSELFFIARKIRLRQITLLTGKFHKKMKTTYEIKIPSKSIILFIISFIVIVLMALVNYEKLKLSDIITVFATLLAPILAVQIQSILDIERSERKAEEEKLNQIKEAEEEKLNQIKSRHKEIFTHLMVYRSTPTDFRFTQAFNVIPIDFAENQNVISAWKGYFNALNVQADQINIADVEDKKAELLRQIGESLGYKFTLPELKGEGYSPIINSNIENLKTSILLGALDVINGKKAINVTNKDLTDFIQGQKENN